MSTEIRDRRADDRVDPTTPEVRRILFRTDPERRTQDYRIAGVCPVDHVVITANMPLTTEGQGERTITIHAAMKLLETFTEAWKQHSLERHR